MTEMRVLRELRVFPIAVRAREGYVKRDKIHKPAKMYHEDMAQ
jgi:hypothetical protein